MCDSIGNRTDSTSGTASAVYYCGNALNQYTAIDPRSACVVNPAEQLRYDLDGNLTNAGMVQADFDVDGDVDMPDYYNYFSACFNGANRPPKAGCPSPATDGPAIRWRHRAPSRFVATELNPGGKRRVGRQLLLAPGPTMLDSAPASPASKRPSGEQPREHVCFRGVCVQVDNTEHSAAKSRGATFLYFGGHTPLHEPRQPLHQLRAG